MASTSEPEHYFETLPGQMHIDDAIAASIAKEAAEAHPGRAVARIGRACYGERWHGKMAEDIGENHRTVRRWEIGECRPSPQKIARIETVARAHIARIERALGLR